MTKNELYYLLNYIMIGLTERNPDGSQDTELINEIQLTLYAFKDDILDSYKNMTQAQLQTNYDNVKNKINNCEELQLLIKNSLKGEMN